MKIYDGNSLISGRLAAKVAKDLINGEEVAVINAQGIVLSGKPSANVDRMQRKRRLTDKRNPENAEKFPRVPYMLFKKTVRGMLPKKSQRGRDALKNLKVYNGAPAEIDASNALRPQDAQKKGLLKSMTLGNLCKAFGYNSR